MYSNLVQLQMMREKKSEDEQTDFEGEEAAEEVVVVVESGKGAEVGVGEANNSGESGGSTGGTDANWEAAADVMDAINIMMPAPLNRVRGYEGSSVRFECVRVCGFENNQTSLTLFEEGTLQRGAMGGLVWPTPPEEQSAGACS